MTASLAVEAEDDEATRVTEEVAAAKRTLAELEPTGEWNIVEIMHDHDVREDIIIAEVHEMPTAEFVIGSHDGPKLRGYSHMLGLIEEMKQEVWEAEVVSPTATHLVVTPAWAEDPLFSYAPPPMIEDEGSPLAMQTFNDAINHGHITPFGALGQYVSMPDMDNIRFDADHNAFKKNAQRLRIPLADFDFDYDRELVAA
jgi:hypothetical protein